MTRNGRARRLLPILLVFVLVGGYRASLIGWGTMSMPDEQIYYKAGLALNELRAHHVVGALSHIASSRGRPGNPLVHLVPAALQGVPFAFGIAPSNPRSLMIPAGFTVAVSLVTLYLFWRISLLLFQGDRMASTIAVAIYGVLLNNNMYVRHLAGYEPALCLGMGALWLALARPPTRPLAFAVGLLSGSMIIVYPGYYLFAAVPCVALVAVNAATVSAVRLRRAVEFASGAAIVIASTEILCRIGGASYLAEAVALSQTVKQGSFDEGWTFLPIYLTQVEQYAGVMLLAGVAAYLGRVGVELWRGARVRPIDWLMFAAVAGWGWQAGGAFFLHTMVLNGRLLHPWMAFLVWATLDSITWVPRAAWRTALYTAAIGTSMVSWIAYAPEFARLAYPGDVLYSLRVNTAWLPALQKPCLMQPHYPYESPGPLNRQTGYPYVRQDETLVLNFCIGVPPAAEPRPTAIAVDGRRRLLYEAPHFMAFRAYRFEGLTPQERSAIGRPEFWLRVYAGSSSAPSVRSAIR